jgi:hypothetical protein
LTVAREEVHDSPVGWVAKHIKRQLVPLVARGRTGRTLMTGVFPTYASIKRKTKREIPVVVIERQG